MISTHISTNLLIGFAGVTLSLLSVSMRNMQSLRQVAIGANLVFIAYGFLESQWPTIVLSSLLLPVNTWRLIQLKRLVREIDNAKADTPIAEWLLPHMTARNFSAGHLLFNKGDPADVLYFIHTGQVRLIEIDLLLGHGQLFGDMGIFSSARQRTLGVVCQTDCKLYTMTRDDVYKLYYQQPKLGFLLINLIVNRVTDSKIEANQRSAGPALAMAGES